MDQEVRHSCENEFNLFEFVLVSAVSFFSLMSPNSELHPSTLRKTKSLLDFQFGGKTITSINLGFAFFFNFLLCLTNDKMCFKVCVFCGGVLQNFSLLPLKDRGIDQFALH